MQHLSAERDTLKYDLSGVLNYTNQYDTRLKLIKIVSMDEANLFIFRFQYKLTKLRKICLNSFVFYLMMDYKFKKLVVTFYSLYCVILTFFSEF